jgi:hypothetical protein
MTTYIITKRTYSLIHLPATNIHNPLAKNLKIWYYEHVLKIEMG